MFVVAGEWLVEWKDDGGWRELAVMWMRLSRQVAASAASKPECSNST